MNEAPIPTDDIDAPAAFGTARAVELYDQRGLGVATFFGSALAAGVLLYRNAGRLGRDDGGKHLIVCFGILAAVMTIAMLLPDVVPNVLYFLAQFGLVVAYYGSVQKGDVEAHVAQGGPVASRWGALGIALLCSLVLGVVIFGVLLASGGLDDL